jgi:1,4-dihydroxy-2-naphthoate octaprenyltransferase
LWINELPDYAADRGAGKRTLVVGLGRVRASRVFCVLIGVAFALAAAAPLAGTVPRGAWLGLVGLGPALAACARIVRHAEDTPALIPAQRNTLLAFLLYAVGAGLGLL